MREIDWKRKLTSRKFWVAVVALASGLMLLFRVDGETVDKVCGVIMEAAAVIAYIIGEGLADAAGVTIQTQGKHEPIYGYFEEDED